MSQPPQDNNLKALWQGQASEVQPMSVDAIRTRAARYTTRRRWSYLAGFALMLLEMVIFGRYALTAPDMMARLGMLVILVGLGWMIARFSLGWPGRLPKAQVSAATILEFHRTELQRQRVTFTNLMITAGPVLAGVVFFGVVGAFRGPHRSVLQAAPLIALTVLWIAVAFWLSRRQERQRLRRLAEVDATRLDE